MSKVRNSPETAPPGRVVPSRVPRLAFEAARRAEAMGIVAASPLRADVETIRELANHVRRAGIGTSAADILNNVEQPDQAELAALLETIVAALEASPVPRFEWRGLARVFSPDELAALLAVSVSSLKRYQSGERETPDDVAGRLHLLALIVGDLAGSYNDVGIRRWFHRKRTLLGGRTPASFLKPGWDPDDEGPSRVRALARELVTMSVA